MTTMIDRRFLRRFLREDRGAVLVFVAIGLPMFLGMIALVYDIGLVRLQQTRLQIAADAAAMAAAQQAADPAAAQVAALRAADANYAGTLPDGGVTFVHWNAATRTVEAANEAAGRPVNAVSAVTLRDAETNSLVPAIFSRAAGLDVDGFGLSASAVALIASAPGCMAPSGVLAGNGIGKWDGDGGASFADLCVYHGNPGRMSGVSDGLRLPGTKVIVTGKQDDALFQIPEDLRNRENERVRDSHGVSATLDLTPVTGFVQGEVSVVDDYRKDPPSDWPSAMTIKPTFEERTSHDKGLKVEEDESLCSSGPRKKACDEDDPGTWHRVKGKVTIEEGADPIRNVVIWATGDIELEDDVRLSGATLVAGGKITIGDDVELTDVTLLAVSEIEIGESVTLGASGGSAFDSYLFSGGDVSIDEDARFEAVFLGLGNEGGSGANLRIDADGRFDETTMVASGWIEIDEGTQMTGGARTSVYPMVRMNVVAAAGGSETVALVR